MQYKPLIKKKGKEKARKEFHIQSIPELILSGTAFLLQKNRFHSQLLCLNVCHYSSHVIVVSIGDN